MDKKTLIYLPIIHTQKDMGDLSDSVRRATVKTLGEKSMRQKNQVVNRMWAAIEEAIDDLDLLFEKVRLYQDGLPVCGREVDIVKDLANSGSRNHRLLERLMDKGATLMGTESAELLLEEYRLIKQSVSLQHQDTGDETSLDLKRRADLLLRKRDQFIAQRINSTLIPGETGIIFLGMLHNPAKYVDTTISIVYPITTSFSNKGI